MIFRFTYLAAAALLALPSSFAQPSPDSDPTKQVESDWVDDRWQQMDVGQFLHAAIATPGRPTPKGIAIRLAGENTAAVCFDTDLMRYSAGWTGGFIKTHPQRYGLIAHPLPAGTIQFTTPAEPGWAFNGSWEDPRDRRLGPLPRHWAKFKGIHRNGSRVVLAYAVGNATVLDSPDFDRTTRSFVRTLNLLDSQNAQLLRVAAAKDAEPRISGRTGQWIITVTHENRTNFIALVGDAQPLYQNGYLVARITPQNGRARVRILLSTSPTTSAESFEAGLTKSLAVEDLSPLLQGGPSRWGEPLLTKGVVDRSRGTFAIDTITIPFTNRFNALFFTSGHDFLPNGDAAVSTIHGDVWLVRGLDDSLQNIRWKRFATGLYQPLGLKIVNDRIHVLERDQITVLHDLNGDDEADYYENFNNQVISAGGGHSYATSLETDQSGNFYFTKCAEDTPHGGTALRVSSDGLKLDVLATGFRNPNGLGLSPSGLLTVADQQGNWVPETRLDLIKPGGFYGYVPMHHRPNAPARFDDPLCWIPRSLDNSAGGQVWVPSGVWGPLAGHMLHLSYGRCTFMLILQDQQNPTQGGIVPLPGRFLSGVMRGRFNPRDQHLYLSGLRGWQTAAAHDGCFQRVRYAGAPVQIPIAFTFRTNGLDLTFSTPLDPETASDIESYAAEQWNYKWSEQYGSPDISRADPSQQKRDTVEILSAKLLDDARTIRLVTEPLQPVMQFRLTYNIDSAEGKTLRNDFFATINSLPSP